MNFSKKFICTLREIFSFIFNIKILVKCLNLFFADDDVRFDVDSGLKSVVFLLNNCLITDVRLLLIVGFSSSSCFSFIFSFINDKSLFDNFPFLLSFISSLLSCFRFLDPN
jgi:hypothetical protein